MPYHEPYKSPVLLMAWNWEQKKWPALTTKLKHWLSMKLVSCIKQERCMVAFKHLMERTKPV